ncbi:HD domain-containing protein [Pseudazoarcus pumilus]|uniref:HD domain-containing protein n=1 Tax=Pseudazoarcus pumilus TaxID=2067960 RepID=UPI0018F897BE|nr:HD domain-containing protein [Pseudazoarcus pumilus]
MHPVAVAELVATVEHTPQMLAAALLHDVLEDTRRTRAEVEATFGGEVATLVGWLTDVSRPEGGNRAARKALDRERIAKAPATAKTIKLADLIDNSSTILAYDRGFARIYLPEKALLLEVLREGDPVLWHRAKDLLEDGLRAGFVRSAR